MTASPPSHGPSKGAERQTTLARYTTVIISVILGILIWGYVDARRVEPRTFRIPVEIQFENQSWELVNADDLKDVGISLRGPRQMMAGLQLNEVKLTRRISLPDDTMDPQNLALDLRAQDVSGLPESVVITGFDPSRLELQFQRKVKRYVPVEVVHVEGETPAKGYEVGTILYDKHYVEVWAPADQFSPSVVARTNPISIADRQEYFSTRVGLQPLVLKDRKIRIDESIFVQIDIIEKPATRVIENVPVRLLLATAMEKFRPPSLEPAQVVVTVRGRADRLKDLAPSALTVYIDTRDLGAGARSEYILKPKTLTPEGIEVIKIEPPDITWKVR